MMRADRLVSILLLLQQHGKLPAAELSAKLEVSQRTINRDMEALCAAGIPVYAERGPQGGWRLTDGYRTSLTGLRPNELQSLLLMQPTAALIDLGLSRDYEAGMLKLLAAMPPAMQRDAEYARQRILIDSSGWHASEETFPMLPVIQEAVWTEQQLLISYLRSDETIERTIEPLGLIAKGAVWYVAAAVDGAVRTYRISRIQQASVIDLPVRRPPGFDLAVYWSQSTTAFKSSLPQYTVSVYIQESSFHRLRQARYTKILSAQPTADPLWLAAEVDFQTSRTACEIILSLADAIKVQHPADLKQQIRLSAARMLSLYEQDPESG